jgi:hypothetical protein
MRTHTFVFQFPTVKPEMLEIRGWSHHVPETISFDLKFFFKNWIRESMVSTIFIFLGAKKRLYNRLRRSVIWSVRPSVPMMQLRGKIVMSRLLREEEEEEENWLCRYSFTPRD